MFDADAHDDLQPWQAVGSLAWRLVTAERAKRLGRETPFGPAHVVQIADLRAARVLADDGRIARGMGARDPRTGQIAGVTAVKGEVRPAVKGE